MKKKSFKVFLSLVLSLSLIIMTGSFIAINGPKNVSGAISTKSRDNSGESWGEDYFDATLSFRNYENESTVASENNGPYQTGEYFYFQIRLHTTNNMINKNLVNKVNLKRYFNNSTSDFSDFEYKSNNVWKDASDYLGSETDKTPITTYTSQTKFDYNTLFRVRFNKPGVYSLMASCIAEDDSFELFLSSTRYIEITDTTYCIGRSINEVTPQTYNVTIDGQNIDTVTEGDSYTIPSTASVGYFDINNNKMIHSGSTIGCVTEDINLKSVNEVNVSNATGASILMDGSSNGIKFQTSVVVKNIAGTDISSDVLTTDAIDVGTILTTTDKYDQSLSTGFTLENCSQNLTIERDYYNVVNPKDNWAKNTPGLCYAGLRGIIDNNVPREMTARGYAKLNYDDTSEFIYAPTENRCNRSIKEVAQGVYNNDFAKLTTEQKELIKHYLDIE